MILPRISVIIPVYNTGSLLTRCVESLFVSVCDPDRFEILLIDDGSTDDSLAVAIALSENYPQLRVIAQANQGLSGARNTGIDSAKGEYLWFVDSDDYVAPGSLSVLTDYLTSGWFDILQFRMALRADDDGGYDSVSEIPLPAAEVTTGWQLLSKGYLPSSACSALYRRSFLLSHGLRFNPCAYREDVEFTGRVFCLARRVSAIDRMLYYYYCRPGSITTGCSLVNRLRLLGAELTTARSFRDFAASRSDHPGLDRYMLWRSNMLVMNMMLSILGDPRVPVAAVRRLLAQARAQSLYPMPLLVGSIKNRLMWGCFNFDTLFLLIFKYKRYRR